MFVMSPKTYDFFQKLVRIILPAISALYIGLAELWGLPGSLQVAGTCSLLAVFIGACLGISSNTYNKLNESTLGGDIIITTTADGKKLFSLDVHGDPLELENQASIKFNVRPAEEPA